MTPTFLENIEELNRLLLKMATLSEEMVNRALDALRNQNTRQARVVIAKDKEIDSLEVEINSQILRALSFQQPLTVDLRLILAAHKVNNDLERVADHAVNIAEAAIALAGSPHIKPLVNIPKMAQIATEMLKESIDSFVYRNPEQALSVKHRDDEIDELHRLVQKTLSSVIHANPQYFDRAVHLIGVSTDLERIADLATNIAEEAFFVTEADILKHKTL